MFRIAVVDDDAKDTDILKGYISKYAASACKNAKENPYKFDVTVFSSGDEFLGAFPSDFDAVFLDIDMPGTSGMEAAKALRKEGGDVAIIFVTNMAKYALAGYEVQALDFIVKPVSYGDFALKFSKVLEYCRRNASRMINLRLGESSSVNIGSADITYIEVMQHYLVYHTTDGGEYRVRGTIGDAESRLAPYAFARASKSFLVNLRHVGSINGQEIRVGADVIYMGRTKRESFVSAFYRYVGGML